MYYYICFFFVYVLLWLGCCLLINLNSHSCANEKLKTRNIYIVWTKMFKNFGGSLLLPLNHPQTMLILDIFSYNTIFFELYSICNWSLDHNQFVLWQMALWWSSHCCASHLSKVVPLQPFHHCCFIQRFRNSYIFEIII